MMLRLLFAASLGSLAIAMPAAAQPGAAPPGAVQPRAAAPGAEQSGAPLSFADAVSAAESHAESVTIARSNVDRAHAQVTSARAGYYPTANGSLAYQRTLASEFDNINFGQPMTPDSDVELPFGQRNNWRINVNASMPIFDGLRTKNAVDAAQANVRASQLNVHSTRAQVVLEVAQAYYDAVLAQRQVEIAEVTLQQAEQTFTETELGFKQGSTPEFDLVRAEVARDNQRTQLVQFRVQRDVTLVGLRRLIGVPVDKPLQLTTQLDADDVEQLLTTVRSAAGIATTSRVAVAQAKETVAAREASVRLAKSDFLPSLAAGTDFGLVNYQNHPFNSDWRENWTLGLTLSLPIFDGFRRKATVKSTQADLASARAQLQFSRELSDVEIARARATVEASQFQLETSVRTVKQAKRAYDIAELRFSQGHSTHLEMVDARVQLEQALLVQARAARDLRMARVREELLPALPIGVVVF